MTNKIDPVSKAAALFFMNEVGLDSETSLYTFLLAHNVQLGEVGVDDASFAAFCRAVADQLDPISPECNLLSISNISIAHVMHTVFKTGFYYYYRTARHHPPGQLDLMCTDHFPCFQEMIDALQRDANNTQEMHVFIRELAKLLGEKDHE